MKKIQNPIAFKDITTKVLRPFRNGIFIVFLILITFIGLSKVINYNVKADTNVLDINEFTRDWVEIKNSTGGVVSLSDYTFSCTSVDYTKSNEGLIVDSNGDPIESISPYGIISMSLHGLCGDLSVSYPNGILLLESPGWTISRVIYGDSELAQIPLPEIGQSAIYYDWMWLITNEPTQGLENTAPLPKFEPVDMYRSGEGNWNFSHTKFLTSGDYNYDGNNEIAVLFDHGDGDIEIIVFVSDGDVFSKHTAYRSGVGMWDVKRIKYLTSGDFNYDGREEIGAMYDYGKGDMGLVVFK